MAITNSLKLLLKDTYLDYRPNGGDYSFPSGHTASAFRGAFFLQNRYGAEYGASAIGLAALTGYSRVKGYYHHWRDVISGAAIAWGTNYFIVSEYKPKDLNLAFAKEGVLLNMKLTF